MTHRVLKKDLNLKKIAPKFIPKVLTDTQKAFRVKLCEENIAKIEQDPGILARLIATDESWVYTYDLRTKQADMEWVANNVPHPRKALRGWSQKKTLLILYFDSHGVITTFFVEETVDSDIYLESLRQMREDIRCKWPHLWVAQNFILLQDNASPIPVSLQLTSSMRLTRICGRTRSTAQTSCPAIIGRFQSSRITSGVTNFRTQLT